MEPPCLSPPSSPPPPRSRPARALRSRSTSSTRIAGDPDAAAGPRRARRAPARGWTLATTRAAGGRSRRIELAVSPGGAAESYRITADAASVVDHRRGRRRPLLRSPDARPAHRARRRRLGRAGRRDRGRAPLRVSRRDARRRPPLPPRRDGEGLHRPRRGPEVQRACTCTSPTTRAGASSSTRGRSSPSSPRAPPSAATRAASTRRPTIARSSSTRHPAT